LFVVSAMSYDEADEMRYLGYTTSGGGGKRAAPAAAAAAFAAEAPAKRNGSTKSVRFSAAAAVEEDDDAYAPKSRQRPKPNRASLAVTDDVDEVDRMLADQLAIPSTRRFFPKGSGVVGRVDPLVSMCATVQTSPECKLYLKEIVPVSRYLAMCALGASYDVQLTPKAKLAPRPVSDVRIKPVKDPERSTDHVQPFNVERVLHAAMDNYSFPPSLDGGKGEGPPFEEQVRAYMLSLGPLTSDEVCDVDFVETHTEAFKRIARGELVPLRSESRFRAASAGPAATVGGGGGGENEEEYI
jgi:hypothetical protein